MKLYGHHLSTCTRKVLCTLAEKGHTAEFVFIDFAKNEQKQPAHLARQPFGVVPVLEDADFSLYESRAIIRYLDARLDGPALTPTNVRERARMDQWISVEQGNFSGPVMKAVMHVMFAPMRGEAVDPAIVAEGKAGGARVLDVLEKALADREYLAGGYSLADICYLPYLEYAFATGMGDIITERPNVNGWWQRISSRPAWQKAIGQGA